MEIVSFNTEHDLYAGERFFGHEKSIVHSPRISGKLIALLAVCVDDMHPGWVTVQALASEVKREAYPSG